MPDPTELKFEKVFNISSFGIWFNGSHPSLPRGWRQRSFGNLSICISCFFILCNSILLHRIPKREYDDVVRESIMTTVAFTLICKYIILVRNRHTVLNLIRYIDDNYVSERFSEAERKIISKYRDNGVFVTKFWFVVTLISSLIFIFKSLLLSLYYHCKGEDRYVQIFEVVYPSFLDVHKNKLFGFIGLSFLSAAFAVYSMMVYIGFEPLLSIFLLHFCGQLEILSTRMRNIFKDTKNSEDVFYKIKQINIELRTIYKLVDDVQITFVGLFEFTMKTTTFLLPFTGFQIVQALRDDIINIEFLSLLIAILLQFYMPCLYSNLLMEKSEYLRQSIYSCGWEENSNLKINKMVIFMLTRTGKPVVLRTIFYPLILDTFAEMCRQAYAIYSIMSAVWA